MHRKQRKECINERVQPKLRITLESECKSSTKVDPAFNLLYLSAVLVIDNKLSFEYNASAEPKSPREHTGRVSHVAQLKVPKWPATTP